MPGRNIGHVEFIVDFDGDKLPRQAREIGEKAGAGLSEGLDKGFDEQLTKFGSRLRKEMDQQGRSSGLTFTDAFEQSVSSNLDDTVREISDIFTRQGGFDQFAGTFDSIGDASQDLDRKLGRLHDTGRVTDAEFTELTGTLRQYESAGTAAARATEKQNAELFELEKQVSGNRLSAALDDLAASQKAARTEAEDHGRELDRQARSVSLAEKFFRKEAAAVSEGGRAHGLFTREGDRTERVLGRLGQRIKDINIGLPEMSHGFRQAIFYTGLFTALAPGIATLGSAAGSGLVSLATGAGALGIGLAATIAGFRGMLGDLDKIEPKARASAKALQAFKQPLAEMQDAIQGDLFDGLDTGIDSLRTRTLPRITDGMRKTARTVNSIFDDMLDRLTSDRALSRFDAIFSGLQPILKGLGSAALNLGGAIGTIFQAGLGSGRGFAEFLDRTTGKFNDFLNNTDGQKALTKFFEHLDVIMPGVGNLIAGAGRAVSGLVTDDSVKNMRIFLDTMSTTLPSVVGGLGKIVTKLDPLNLVADGLSALGDFFDAHGDDFERLGQASNDLVRSGFSLIGDVLGKVGDALLKVSPAIIDDIADGLDNMNSPGLKKALDKNLPKLADLLGDIADLAPGLGSLLGQVLPVAFDAIGDAAKVAAPPVQLLAAGLNSISGNAKDAQKNLDDIDWEGFSDGAKGLSSLLSLDGFTKLGTLFGEDTYNLFTAEGRKGAGKMLEGFGQTLGVGLGPAITAAGKLLQGDTSDSIFSQEGRNKAAAFFEGLSNAPIVGGLFNLISRMLGDDTTDTTFDTKGASAGAAFLKGLEQTPVIGSFIKLIDNIFGDGDSDGKAKKKGKQVGDDVVGGLDDASLSGQFTKFLDKLLTDDGSKAKKKGKEVAKDIADGLGDATFSGQVSKFLSNLFGGGDDDGGGKAKEKGKAAGASFVTGVGTGITDGTPAINLASTTASTQMTAPFNGTPATIGAATAGIPGVIAGVLGLVTGQPGADNTANPFSAVPGRVGANANGIPGVIAGILGLVTGQPGADNTANPFSAVPGRIGGNVAATPGVIGGYMGAITGQPGADNVVQPFSGVPGSVGSKVAGTSGAVSGALRLIDDFGAAARIVSAFSGVPGLVQGALSGLGGIVSRALSAAQTAVAIGVGGIAGAAGGAIPRTAVGGMFDGAQVRVIGEAGPEAVVPLNRPLSRVDPAVRDLSAIAQGKSVGGRSNGPTYGTYVAPGAIAIAAPNSDPRAVAAATIDRLVQKAIG